MQVQLASFPKVMKLLKPHSTFSKSGDSDFDGSNPDRVKIDTCHFLVSHSALVVGSVSGYCDCVGYQVMVLVAWFPSGEAL